MGWLLILLFFLIGSRIGPQLNTIIHEAGHAVPTFFVSPHPFTVYLGAYGKIKGTTSLKFGRVTIVFPVNFFSWRGGMVAPDKEPLSIPAHIAIVAGGPLASLLLSAGCLWMLEAEIGHLFWRLFIAVLFFYGLETFIRSTWPSDTPLQLPDGTVTYNDGNQLRRLFFQYRNKPVFEEINKQLSGENPGAAAELAENLIRPGKGNTLALQLAVACHLENNAPERAIELARSYSRRQDARASEWNDIGLRLAYKNLPAAAFECFEKAVQSDPYDKLARVNHAYCQLVLGRNQEAVDELSRVMKYETYEAYALANRGLARIRLGEAAEGLQDLEDALQKNDQEPYVHLNLGIYQFEQQQYGPALEHFERAHALNPHTHSLEKYLEDTRAALQNPKSA